MAFVRTSETPSREWFTTASFDVAIGICQHRQPTKLRGFPRRSNGRIAVVLPDFIRAIVPNSSLARCGLGVAPRIPDIDTAWAGDPNLFRQRKIK